MGEVTFILSPTTDILSISPLGDKFLNAHRFTVVSIYICIISKDIVNGTALKTEIDRQKTYRHAPKYGDKFLSLTYGENMLMASNVLAIF